MHDRPVFRFAPSPNGELHLGHALSAIVGYERAKAAGGRFLLRIEDIDVGRTRPEFVAGIFEDLRWLGLTWEEPVLFQSQRMEAYGAAARRLQAAGPAISRASRPVRRSKRRRATGRRTRMGRRFIQDCGRAAAHPISRACTQTACVRRCASTWRRRAVRQMKNWADGH